MYIESDTIVCPGERDIRSDFRVTGMLLEKGSGITNDDALFGNNDICVVCDGATSLFENDSNAAPESGGRVAAQITADVFSKNSGCLSEMAAGANDRIRDTMEAAGVDLRTRERIWSTSFAAARIVEGRLEWAQSGDCMILLLYGDGGCRLATEGTGHDQDVLEKWGRIGAKEDEPIQQVLAEEIAEVRKQMNRTYGVLNGEPEALDFVKYGVESLESVESILLFSDGFWPPSSLPSAEPDVEKIAALYRRSGLDGVRDRIRAVERTDLGCHRFPRFKIHDDISAIALERSR